MKKRKLTALRLKKQVVSALNHVTGGSDKDITITCARPVSDCTIALTVQPEVCQTLPRPYSECTVALSVQQWCNVSLDVKC